MPEKFPATVNVTSLKSTFTADIVPAKLDWARGFGATHTVGAQGEALTRAVLELTGGIGVDHAFVCIDPPATLEVRVRAAAVRFFA